MNQIDLIAWCRFSYPNVEPDPIIFAFMQTKEIANASATTAEKKTSSSDRNAHKPAESKKSGEMLLQVDMRTGPSRAYLLADAHCEDAMALCLSFGLEMQLTQTTNELDLTAKLKQLRGFNTRKIGYTPDVLSEDFLQPVDMNVTFQQGKLEMTAAVQIGKVLLRSGFNNLYLVQRALNSLSPPATSVESETKVSETKFSETKVSETKVSETEDSEIPRSEQKYSNSEPEHDSPATSTESREKQEDSSALTQKFEVDLPLLMLYVINDRGSSELPLLQLKMHQVSATYNSLANQWDQYTANVVDCLRANVVMSVAVDSFNEEVTMWEPVVEPWAMKLEARQGPDPQKRIAKYGTMHEDRGQHISPREWHRLRQQDPKRAHIQNAMKITISTKDVLDLNLTVPFINLCLSIQDMMKQTDVGFTDDGRYTHVENQLGKDIHFDPRCEDAMLFAERTGESGSGC